MEIGENILPNNFKSDADLLILLRTKDDFRAAIEMLMLKITETLGNMQLLETIPCSFLDEPIPVLIGKNLRNYLAHGDLLIDLLSIDHLKSIIFHFRSIQKYCSKADLVVYDGNKRIGNAKLENIKELEKDYEMSLKQLTKRKQLINVVKENNTKSLKSFLNSEIELKYRNFNGWTLLFFTAETDNLEMFIYLIETNNRTSIYYKDKLGYSILYYLAKFGSINILKYLIERSKLQVDPNVILHRKKCLLHISSKFGQSPVSNFFLENGIDANAVDERGATPIFYALMNNHLDVILSLIKFEADSHFKHPANISFLHYVVTKGCAEALQLLIDKNVDNPQQYVNAINIFSQTPLHLACRNGHLNVVQLLVKNRARVDAVDDYGKTPLYFAAQEGHEKIVEYLLENKASVHLLSATGISALHEAALYGHLQVVKLLLEHGGLDVNAKTQLGGTPLYFACSSNQYAVVKFLLDNDKTEVNATHNNGLTAIHKAAGVGNVDLIEILLDHGASINAVTNEGNTPLHLAAQDNSTRVVDLLLKREAKINASNDEGVRPIEAAMNGRRLENIFLLLENDASVHVEPRAKSYPLAFKAIDYGYEEVLKALIDKHDIIDYQMDTGKTMLHFATFVDNSNIVELLLKSKANVKLVDNSGISALHDAVRLKRKSVVEVMLRIHPELVDLQSSDGFTPLHGASIIGHRDLVEVLLDKGANVNLASEKNKTALYYAAGCGHLNVVECLLEKGADANAKADDQSTPLHALSKRVVLGLANKLYPLDEREERDDECLGRVKIAECLIKYGAEVNAIDEKKKRSALHWAAINGQHEMIRVLCKSHALLEERDITDCTALQWAGALGHIKCVVYLMMFGVDPRGSCTRKHFTEFY